MLPVKIQTKLNSSMSPIVMMGWVGGWVSLTQCGTAVGRSCGFHGIKILLKFRQNRSLILTAHRRWMTSPHFSTAVLDQCFLLNTHYTRPPPSAKYLIHPPRPGEEGGSPARCGTAVRQREKHLCGQTWKWSSWYPSASSTKIWSDLQISKFADKKCQKHISSLV